jgi:hypothetical protein
MPISSGHALESDVIHAAAWAEGETEAKLAQSLQEEVLIDRSYSKVHA